MPEYIITPIPTIQINLSNITSCIPVEKIIESAPYLSTKADAINLGIIMFFAGMVLAYITSYVWWRMGRM